MKPTEVLPFRQCSDISRKERFICVQPLSGYRMIQPEDDGYAISGAGCKRRCFGTGVAGGIGLEPIHPTSR